MKILLITHEYNYNGAVMVLFQLARHLVQNRGWQVDVFSNHCNKGEFKQKFSEIGVGTPETVVPGQYDLAIINTLINGNLVPQIAKHVKTILWIHEGMFPLVNEIIRFSDIKNIFKISSKVIFDQEFQVTKVFASHLFGLPTSKIAVINPAMEPMGIVPAPLPRREGRKRILFLGSIYARKGPQDLIQAVVALNSPQVECVLIGWTELLHTLGEEAVHLLNTRKDLFTLTGNVDRQTVLGYYAGSDLFCLPSHEETFGISAMEAALYGLPVVLTDLPAYQGIWTHGINSLLVPVGDVHLLTWMLKMMLEDDALRLRLAKAAQANAKRFPISAFNHKVDNVIDELID